MPFSACPNVAISLSSSALSGVAAEPCAGASASALKSNTSKVFTETTAKKRREVMRERFAHKFAAANLLKSHDEKKAVRLSKCGYVAYQTEVLGTLKTAPETGAKVASFKGVISCGSVWLCPCCSPRISGRRKDELDSLMQSARAEGLAVVMMTLTARHSKRTKLASFLDALKAAVKRMRQRRQWAALDLVGTVTATEVTHGEAGWHPHMHMLVLVKGSAEEACAKLQAMWPVWRDALAAEGLTATKSAFDVRSAMKGEYLAKFAAASEMTLATEKQGRNGSRNPWQLLADAEAGDGQASALWLEYAAAFVGKRQLFWSQGLKARFGIGETSDEEAAAEAPEPLPEVEIFRVWLGKGSWREARRRRVSIQYAAEAGLSLDVAEFGPTDAERWRRTVKGGVIEYDG